MGTVPPRLRGFKPLVRHQRLDFGGLVGGSNLGTFTFTVRGGRILRCSDAVMVL